MKRSITIAFIASMLLGGACQQKKEGGNFHNLSTEITKEISGEVICPDNGHCRFYDIAITDDYFAFMDYESDTLLQVFNKRDFSLHLIALRETDTFKISYPEFVKYDYANKGKKNAVTIWDNEAYRLRRIDLDNTAAAPFTAEDSGPLPLSQSGTYCYNPCITQKYLFAPAYLPGKASVFFSDNPTGGIYNVPPYPLLEDYLPENILTETYASNLIVNEEKDRIVAALRFVSSVNFYDMNCDILGAACYGDYYSIPIADITGKFLDAEHSTKSFIDICCSEEYVFCLYDGSTDFSLPSTLVIFDWDGNPVGSFRTDRSLRKIATDPSGTYLIGLAANENERRDIVRYQLDKFL